MQCTNPLNNRNITSESKIVVNSFAHPLDKIHLYSKGGIHEDTIYMYWKYTERKSYSRNLSLRIILVCVKYM